MGGQMYLTPKQHKNFWNKVKKTGTCWLWTAAQDSNGYGNFNLYGKGKATHRMSYEMFVGNIPKDIKVSHTCKNFNCIRPEHLFLNTIKDVVIRLVKINGYKNMKLTPKRVIELFSYKDKMSHTKIAKAFGVSRRLVRGIMCGERWSSVTGIQRSQDEQE